MNDYGFQNRILFEVEIRDYIKKLVLDVAEVVAPAEESRSKDEIKKSSKNPYNMIYYLYHLYGFLSVIMCFSVNGK
jgi:hypothetical protein